MDRVKSCLYFFSRNLQARMKREITLRKGDYTEILFEKNHSK